MESVKTRDIVYEIPHPTKPFTVECRIVGRREDFPRIPTPGDKPAFDGFVLKYTPTIVS